MHNVGITDKVYLLICLTAALAEAGPPCLPCHTKQVAAYARTPMGSSFGPATPAPPASFTHAESQTQFRVLTRDGRMVQRAERNGLAAEHPVEYRIGSGNHATGYLVRMGQWLFQSPIASYRRQGKWAMAPGYERMLRPDFNRRVEADCLNCHAGGSASAPEPIGCEACHGSPELHLTTPSRGNITNPSRLPAAERDAVCEQCHLNGEALVPQPPKFSGAAAVIVFDRPSNDLRVVSHVEQLARSACARQSNGKLWCGTCHQPHSAAMDISAECRNCHATELPDSHRAHSECASCHMPKRDVVDGGHTAFTDHRIQRTAATLASAGPSRLRLWRDVADPGLRERHLGLASILVGERDGSTALINEGFRRLSTVFSQWPRDPDVLAGLGMVLFLKDQKQDAVKLLRAAVAERPGDAALQEKLALLRRAAGDEAGAIESLERSLALDPGRQSSYFFLAETQPNRAARRKTLERLLLLYPRSLIGQEAMRELTRP